VGNGGPGSCKLTGELANKGRGKMTSLDADPDPIKKNSKPKGGGGEVGGGEKRKKKSSAPPVIWEGQRKKKT